MSKIVMVCSVYLMYVGLTENLSTSVYRKELLNALSEGLGVISCIKELLQEREAG